MLIKSLKVLAISVLGVFGQLSYESSAVYRVLCIVHCVCVRVRVSMRVPAFKFKVVLRGCYEEYAIL